MSIPEYTAPTRIIAGFPTIGKTSFHKEYPETTVDLDLSMRGHFDISKEKMKNLFYREYIEELKGYIGSKTFIFVPAYPTVLNLMDKHCLHYTLLFPTSPSNKTKNIYLERMINRDNCQVFQEFFISVWEDWYNFCFNHHSKSIQTDSLQAYIDTLQ